MNILKLKLLSLQYQMELKNNNKEHLKDYIVTKLIADNFLESNILHVENAQEYSFRYKLFDFLELHHFHGVTCFKIPTLDEIKKYKRKLKIGIHFIPSYDYRSRQWCAAGILTADWIKLMLQQKMIFENEIIDTRKYILYDFVTDPKLQEILFTIKSEFSFNDYILNEKDVKKKTLKK